MLDILNRPLVQVELQVPSLGVNLALLIHQSLLLALEVRNHILQIANRLMQEVTSVVLVSDLMLQLIESLVQFVPLRILDSDFCLELSHLGVAVLLKLLFVLLKLNELIVEHLNLFLLSSEHIFMVPL